jgi:5'-nucleotidase
MRILLCNDDGIYAPGIAALAEAVRDLGEIHVVAPEAEQSAVGHAITIAYPLKVKKVRRGGRFFGHAVSGTPADCVKLAVSQLLPEPPDLILSGINLGANTGISVLYSGTVSGASEGIILGIPSIAFSLCTFTDPLWDTATRVARAIVEAFPGAPLPADALLNVNIPNLPYEALRGVAAVPVGKSHWIEEFDARLDPRGNAYYWMNGALQLYDDHSENDVERVREGFVAVTPLQTDLTHYAALAALRGSAWDGLVLESADP